MVPVIPKMQEISPPSTNIHQPAVKVTHADQDFSEFPINTLIQYIEDMNIIHVVASLYSKIFIIKETLASTPLTPKEKKTKEPLSLWPNFCLQE